VPAVALISLAFAVLGLAVIGFAWDGLVTRYHLRAEVRISEGRLNQAIAAERRVKILQDQLGAVRGEYAAYLVELYNFNGLPMLSFYAAESELSAHIFAKDENVTTARVRVLRLHGPAPGAPPADGVTADPPVPTFRDRLSQG
jgi:hypothetical protein